MVGLTNCYAISMRTIKRTSQFKKDYKRERKTQHGKILDDLLVAIVTLLASDKLLPAKHYDHALTGEWQEYRDCHIKPGLILIYRKPDAEVLELIRLGSHSELGF